MADNPNAPQKLAVIKDPNHPEAGDGGIVPPVETRFKPGAEWTGNAGGLPKGTHDPRTVLRRKWAANPNEHGEGSKSVQHAERIVAAVEACDEKALECELKLLHEISGKPHDTVAVTHNEGRTIQTVAPDPTRVVPPLPEMPEEE